VAATCRPVAVTAPLERGAKNRQARQFVSLIRRPRSTSFLFEDGHHDGLADRRLN
jgi:hypothetical protein